MKRMGPLSLVGMFAVALLGCGNSDEPPTAEDVERSITKKIVAETGVPASSDRTPCEILDDKLIRAHFDIGADAEIARSPSRVSPHPFCTASWPKSNAAEIGTTRATAMSEYVQKKMRGEKVKMPSFRTSDEVSLTLVQPPFESRERAMSAFERSMKALSKGMTATRENVEVTFQAELTPVEGVGDKAMWAAKMRQISVVDGIRIFHVTVDTGAELDAELETASAIARDVANRL